MSEKTRQITPTGAAKWAWLTKPKEPYKDEKGRQKGEPKYQIDVCFTMDDPLWKAWAQDVKRALDALPTQSNQQGQSMPKQIPIKKELDENDQPTGRYYVTFKTSQKFKPGLFDKHGKKLEDVLVANESKVRVAYIAQAYKEFGGGIAFYLNAVQVLDLIEYQPQDAKGYGFDVEPEPAGVAAAGGAAKPQQEDDLPF